MARLAETPFDPRSMGSSPIDGFSYPPGGFTGPPGAHLIETGSIDPDSGTNGISTNSVPVEKRPGQTDESALLDRGPNNFVFARPSITQYTPYLAKKGVPHTQHLFSLSRLNWYLKSAEARRRYPGGDGTLVTRDFRYLGVQAPGHGNGVEEETGNRTIVYAWHGRSEVQNMFTGAIEQDRLYLVLVKVFPSGKTPASTATTTTSGTPATKKSKTTKIDLTSSPAMMEFMSLYQPRPISAGQDPEDAYWQVLPAHKRKGSRLEFREYSGPGWVGNFWHVGTLDYFRGKSIGRDRIAYVNNYVSPKDNSPDFKKDGQKIGTIEVQLGV